MDKDSLIDDRDRRAIEAAVVSSIMQGGAKVKDLCREFRLTPMCFNDVKAAAAFDRVMRGCPTKQDKERFEYWVPTAANARYYIEELYQANLQK